MYCKLLFECHPWNFATLFIATLILKSLHQFLLGFLYNPPSIYHYQTPLKFQISTEQTMNQGFTVLIILQRNQSKLTIFKTEDCSDL